MDITLSAVPLWLLILNIVVLTFWLPTEVANGLGFVSPLWFTAPGQQLRMMRAGFRWRRHRFEREVDDQVYEVWQMSEGWRACRIDYRYDPGRVGTWDGELYFPTPVAAMVNAEIESWGE